MSDKNFSRRRRGGMRFRPSGGLNPGAQRHDRAASEARAEVLGEKAAPDAQVYDRSRHAHEIERAENIAAGLPPEGLPAQEGAPGGRALANESRSASSRRRFREPNLETPAEVQEETSFEPVAVQTRPPQG